jgi:ferredoxin--NADP+ reductase
MNMKMLLLKQQSLSFFFFWMATCSSVVSGFVPVGKSRQVSSSSSSSLTAYPSKERVVKSGGGIPVVPSGDCLLFDPKVEGMLGGTSNMADRLKEGSSFISKPVYLPFQEADDIPNGVFLTDAQAWLEEIGDPVVPPTFAKATAPVTATVLGRAKLIRDDAPGDIEHVILRLPQGFHYVEGQSLSVIPPGVDPKTGKAHKPRLYSIASTRYGDLLDGSTVSLCVRRAEYTDPATGLVDPSKAGVCSSFLCNAQPGTEVKVAGPVGKTMLLPEDPSQDIIMVATGTGIAPFRAFLHRLFMENTIARHQFTGHAWLILGVPTTGGLLYADEFAAMQQNSHVNGAKPQLEVTYAISREMKNRLGGKLYVQDVLAENADLLFAKLENGASIYFCGLKGMMPGILDALEKVATQRGLNWSDTMSKYKANNQWHVEVY